MIKKTLIFFFILASLWSAFICLTSLKGVSQTQTQDNAMKAQQIIYRQAYTPSVIVGSSLSCRLTNDSIPDFYNLSFGGLSISDGLDILSRREKLPKHIFIEMNIVLRDKNEVFLNSLYEPASYWLRRLVPLFREYNQPVTFFIGSMMQFSKRNQKEIVDKPVDPKVFNAILEEQLRDYSQLPDEKILNERFKSLKQQVDFFESRGVSISFFEIPMNKRLSDSPLNNRIREEFSRIFPRTNYHYIDLPPNHSDYKGSDGLHLGKTEALAFTLYFREKARNFTK